MEQNFEDVAVHVRGEVDEVCHGCACMQGEESVARRERYVQRLQLRPTARYLGDIGRVVRTTDSDVDTVDTKVSQGGKLLAELTNIKPKAFYPEVREPLKRSDVAKGDETADVFVHAAWCRGQAQILNVARSVNDRNIQRKIE